MAPIVPTCVPSSLIAGDTAIWTRAWSDYPVSEGWVAHFALRGASVLDVTADTADDGASFEFTIAASDASKLVAGQYQYRHWVTLNGEKYTVESGFITVEPNAYTAKAGDFRSQTEKELALVNAQIESLLASPMESGTVGNTTFSKRKLEELTTQRGVLTAKLGRERGQQPPTYAMGFRAPR